MMDKSKFKIGDRIMIYVTIKGIVINSDGQSYDDNHTKRIRND